VPDTFKYGVYAVWGVDEFLSHIQISNLLSTSIFMTCGSKLGIYKNKINYQIYQTIPSYSTLPASYQWKGQILC